MGPAVSGFAEVGPALHGLRNVWSTMSAAGAGRPAKRARLEADKRRDALAEVEDKYADIDFTRFQKVVGIDTDADGEATPLRFVLVRPVGTALVKDWRQWSSYEPDEAGETLSEEGLAHLCTTRRQRRHYTGPFGCTVQSNLPAPGELLSKAGSAVQGRTALDKLRKQLAVMCLRIELQHFCGVSGDTIDAAALGRANSNASLVGGEGAVAFQAIAIALAGIGLCPHDRVVVLRLACFGQLEGVCGGSEPGVVLLHHGERLALSGRLPCPPGRCEIVQRHTSWAVGAPKCLHWQARVDFPQAARYHDAWFCCSHDALGHAACWVVRFKWPALRHGASLCRQCRRAVHACR